MQVDALTMQANALTMQVDALTMHRLAFRWHCNTKTKRQDVTNRQVVRSRSRSVSEGLSGRSAPSHFFSPYSRFHISTTPLRLKL
ncbi:hypothetical protein NIES4073_16160 [Kalymmatonema gypsitolerans NIES-4073]|nr:hypothetical protein NIES4073_16160 [Scytonema sp. NIES-4073]